MACGVYFLQSMWGGPIKIGSSTDVDKRIRTHQCTIPFNLRLVAFVEVPPEFRFKYEADVQRVLRKSWEQYGSEWFGGIVTDFLVSLAMQGHPIPSSLTPRQPEAWTCPVCAP